MQTIFNVKQIIIIQYSTMCENVHIIYVFFFLLINMDYRIKLEFGFIDINEFNGIEWSNSTIFLKVIGNSQNIKAVTVKTLISDEWIEFNAVKKLTCNDINESIWQSVITTNSMLGKGPQDIEVCAILETNEGVKVYDNNHEQNYKIPKGCGPYLFEGTNSFAFIEGINSDTPIANLMYCHRNLDLDTTLTLTYSFDNWGSVKKITIPYENEISISADNLKTIPNPTRNIDFRRYNFPWEKNEKTIQFCIEKTNKDGKKEWDNNNTKNYNGLIQDLPNLIDLLNLDNLDELYKMNPNNLSDFSNVFKSIDNLVTPESNVDTDAANQKYDDIFKMLNSMKDIFNKFK